MPVQKYASIAHVPNASTRLEEPAIALRRMMQLVRFGARLRPPLFPPGVHKYPSLASAARAREEAEATRARALRQQAQDRPRD